MTIKKRKITIAIDEDVVQYFQMLGHKEERPYQPLMNKVLRDYVAEVTMSDKYLAATPEQQRKMEQGD